MALLQISEPGQSPAPHQRKVAVGIDLGTTNSLVALVRNGVAETLPDLDGEHLLPSIVNYHSEGCIVGTKAKALAEHDPKNTVRSVKRLIGRKFDEINQDLYPYEMSSSEQNVPFLNLPSRKVNPVQVSADILKALIKRAESTANANIDGAVITVPAYFDDAQRQATKDAAELAGIHLLRLISEPTAAAIAYGLDSKQDGVIAVYDLGGGTFDLSILRLSKGVFEVLATAGDSSLGGDDFDHLLMQEIQTQANLSELNPFINQTMMNQSRAAKIALSDSPEVTINIEGKSLTITRERFNQLIDGLVNKTLMLCRRALKDAKLTIDDVDEVVMVGGSTRVPYVRERIGAFFNRPPLTSIDPDKVVAIGAAIQADILIGNKPDSDLLLLDVIPLSLGIETMGELVEKIIPRNSTIPCARAQEFTTFKDGQTAMMIHVLQGERETVSGCRSLGRFILKGIPPLPAGGAHIRVTFQVDADGLLSVTAMEKSTQIQTQIEIKPSYGLTDSEIATMIKESIDYAEQDRQDRVLNEQKVEAKRLIESIEQALIKDADLLSDSEIPAIQNAINQLKQDSEGSDPHLIKEGIKTLDLLTQQFAADRMNRSIQKALSGKQIDSL